MISKDCIISGEADEVYATIDRIEPVPEYGIYSYRGILVQDSFPNRLRQLSGDYYDCVNNGVLSLLDRISDEIADYGLKLKENDCKIFGLEIFENHVEFFIKRPTADGYKDL